MKAAIPLFRTRVSPRFGCAAEMLVADGEAGAGGRQVLACAGMLPREIAAVLAELGVGTVICAGINCQHESLLAARGIEVIRGVVGEADAVLAAWRTGELKPGTWPALRPRGHCGRRGHRGPPWLGLGRKR